MYLDVSCSSHECLSIFNKLHVNMLHRMCPEIIFSRKAKNLALPQ